jgi:hypothetical protein
MRTALSNWRERRSISDLVLMLLAIGATVWALLPVLTVRAEPLGAQPRPDPIEYADAAWQLAHGHGYVTYFSEKAAKFQDKAFPPRYPFGTSVALAPFTAVVNRFPQGPQIGERAISTLYVIAVITATWLLGGPLAAAIVGVFLALSPFPQVSASLILSDALAGLLAVGILIALKVGRGGRSAAVAGILAGSLLCVRLLGVIAIPAVLLALPGRRRWIAAAFAAPLAAALGAYQWEWFGSPFRTGYGYYVKGLKEISPSYLLGHTTPEGNAIYPDKLNGALLDGVCPCGSGGPMFKLTNLTFYPSVLAGLFWVFAPPFTGLFGVWQLVVERATPAARYAALMFVLNLVVVWFYWDQAARFLSPAATLLAVYSAVGMARLIVRAASALRPMISYKPSLRTELGES